jgi:hypothetical protein
MIGVIFIFWFFFGILTLVLYFMDKYLGYGYITISQFLYGICLILCGVLGFAIFTSFYISIHTSVYKYFSETPLFGRKKVRNDKD